MKTNRDIVIVGCGRLGSILANKLSSQGHSVIVIDKDTTCFTKLSQDFSGFKLEGDATQLSVLENSKLKDSNVFIAATREDNVNIMVALVAKRVFNIPLVLARIFEPKLGQVCTKLGIKTICSTSITAEAFIQTVSGDTLQGENAR